MFIDLITKDFSGLFLSSFLSSSSGISSLGISLPFGSVPVASGLGVPAGVKLNGINGTIVSGNSYGSNLS